MDTIAKIQAIRAKAASSTFENEREMFLRGALRLMEKYGLSESDVVVDPWAGVKVSYGPQGERKQKPWTASKTVVFSENNYYVPGKTALIEEVGRALGISVTVLGGVKEQHVQITGGGLPEVLISAYDAALKLAEKNMPKDVKRVKSRHTSYLIGFAAGMREKRSGVRSHVASNVRDFEAWSWGREAGLHG